MSLLTTLPGARLSALSVAGLSVEAQRRAEQIACASATPGDSGVFQVYERERERERNRERERERKRESERLLEGKD